MRAREFTMKDGHSFHESPEDWDRLYREIRQAYLHISHRCGLEVVGVEADPGLMGGSESHEFMFPSPYGEDFFIRGESGDYAANLESAIGLKDEDPPSRFSRRRRCLPPAVTPPRRCPSTWACPPKNG